MALTLYLHPLSSYCHKALIALYENATPFAPHVVNLGDPDSAAAFKAIWPMGKFPVLADADRIIPESTAIIDYLAARHPGPVDLIPAGIALDVRMLDRFYDLHVHTHMQKIIGDRIRPADGKDPYGVEQARAALDTALGIADAQMASRHWAAGDAFTMADCAAAPPLFYLDLAVMPLAPRFPALAAYLDRLKERPSYARALAEAEPYLQFVPR